MGAKKPAAQAGGGMFGGLDDMFSGLGGGGGLFEKGDAGLDKTMAAMKNKLNRLTEGPQLKNVAATMFKVGHDGFRDDIRELGVVEPDRVKLFTGMYKETWENSPEMKNIKGTEVMRSQELAAMEAHVKKLEGMDQLAALIATEEPRAGWQLLWDKYFGPTGTFGGILAALGIDLFNKDKDKKKKKKKGKKGKKGDPAPTTGTGSETEDTAADEESKIKLDNEKYESITKKLRDAGFDIDPTNPAEQNRVLSSAMSATELDAILKGFDGKKDIWTKIKEITTKRGFTGFKFKISHLFFMHDSFYKNEGMKKVLFEALGGKIPDLYDINNDNVAAFMDDAVKKKGVMTTLIASYQKKNESTN